MKYTKNQIEEIISRDQIFADAYKADFDRVKNFTKFWTGYGAEEPAEIHHWEWSETFRRWGALCTFQDGKRAFTCPCN